MIGHIRQVFLGLAYGLIGGFIGLIILALACKNYNVFGNVADWVSGSGTIIGIYFVYRQIKQQERQYRSDRDVDLTVRTEIILGEIFVTKLFIVVYNNSLSACTVDMVYFQYNSRTNNENCDSGFKYPYTKENPEIRLNDKDGKKFEIDLNEIALVMKKRMEKDLMKRSDIVNLIPAVKLIDGKVFEGEPYIFSFNELESENEGREKYIDMINK